MGKRTKIASIILATMVMTSSLVGCGKSGSDASDKKTMTVYSHLSSNEVVEVEKMAQKWGDENGYTVKVVDEQTLDIQSFKELANSKNCPDVYYGIAHDNLGAFQKAGILAEVPSGVINADDYTSKSVVDAVTINGKQYAVPIAQEAIGLFVNKDLVSTIPTTMEDVVKIGKEKGFMFNVTDFYLVNGFVTSGNGYLFKNNNGTIDPADMGINTETGVKAYQFLQDLVQKDKLVTADITDDIAKDKFLKKETAFYISGPWNVKAAKDAGVNLEVVALPSLNGNDVKPFLGVQSAFVTEKSEKKDDAFKLIQYLNENMNDTLINVGNRLPVLKSGLESDAYKNNKTLAGFVESASKAVPMPNIPEVQSFWTPAKNNLQLLISGQQSAADCAKNTVAQVEEGIKEAK